MPIDLGRTRRASVPVKRAPRMVYYSLLSTHSSLIKSRRASLLFTLLSLLLISASPHIMRNCERPLRPHDGNDVKADGLVESIEI